MLHYFPVLYVFISSIKWIEGFNEMFMLVNFIAIFNPIYSLYYILLGFSQFALHSPRIITSSVSPFNSTVSCLMSFNYAIHIFTVVYQQESTHKRLSYPEMQLLITFSIY